jgi:hypothetical protein
MVATRFLPSFDNSAMDGFAARSSPSKATRSCFVDLQFNSRAASPRPRAAESGLGAFFLVGTMAGSHRQSAALRHVLMRLPDGELNMTTNALMLGLTIGSSNRRR